MRNTLVRSISCLILFFTLTSYTFNHDDIDVVIPAVEKDLPTLDYCIEGIRHNGEHIGRIIVVSKKPLTDKAEWFDEGAFPFTKEDVSWAVFGNRDAGRAGWYFQQLLKLYALFVIPDISSNVLVLDADTIFLRPVRFLNANGGGLYNPGSEYHKPYFYHAKTFLPGFKRYSRNLSGISHHMLFQRPVMEDLFSRVEKAHNTPFWIAFCQCVSFKEIGASEYEIYFNFVMNRTDQVEIRRLKWLNASDINIEQYRKEGYDYVSCHEWKRNQ